jgi:hypothetical protein
LHAFGYITKATTVVGFKYILLNGTFLRIYEGNTGIPPVVISFIDNENPILVRAVYGWRIYRSIFTYRTLTTRENGKHEKDKEKKFRNARGNDVVLVQYHLSNVYVPRIP